MKRSRVSRRLWPSGIWLGLHGAKEKGLDVCSSLRVPAHMVCNGWRGGAGEKMMRKTMEKMREYDIKQWENMGKDGKMMRKTMEKMRDYDIKQWEKMGKQWNI